MTRNLQPSRLDMQALVQEGVPLVETILLQNMKRLAQETQWFQPDLPVKWEARAELRPRADGGDEVWLLLQAKAAIPLTCQRCMGMVITPLEVSQWYRFVANEDIAMAEDDQSVEDLLVMVPQFDLLEVLEDELLMALPLVPMHDQCPAAQVPRAGGVDIAGDSAKKPSPFAVLAQLKSKGG